MIQALNTRFDNSSSAEERQHSYRELFGHPLDHREIHGIREALNQCRVLGSDRFKDEIEQQLKRRVRPGKPGRPRKQKEDEGQQREISV